MSPVTVGLRNERVRLGAAELPGELAPDRVDLGAVVLDDAGRAEVVADDGDAVDLGALVAVGEQQLLRLLRELTHRQAGRDVPQRQHRVGLAATEVGLEVDDRRGVVVAGEAAHRPADQVAETFGEVGALEELDRVGVVGVDLAARGDLVEVGGELGGVEVAGGDVVVRLEHLAPRLEPARCLGVVDRGLEDLLVVPVGRDPPQVQADRLDLVSLRGLAQQRHQPLSRVERAVGVVVGERAVVRPGVAGVLQLGGERLANPTQGVGERIPAGLHVGGDRGLGQHAQLDLGVQRVVDLACVTILRGDELDPVARRPQRRLRRSPTRCSRRAPGR